ncbi:MAG: hypothetical protein EA378_05745 [Phycisphaerales bacterium]|nr:MAG: hypothetical protein EA378_05745 [Phycisphaerales bacterium]
MRRRVVITGIGVVSGLGPDARSLWSGLLEGRSGLRPVETFDATGYSSHLAGYAAGFHAKDVVPKHYRKAVKVMARDIELAVGAAMDAVAGAGLVTRASGAADGETTYPPDRVGASIGAGLIATDVDELAPAFAASVDDDAPGEFSLRKWGEAGINRLQPLWLLKYLPNMLACHVTIIHGAEGPSNTLTVGEASGLLSIGESSRIIERGDVDCAFAGGAECKVTPMGFLRTQLAGRLASTRDASGEPIDDGGRVVRPFDPESPGTIVGEGGGILIVESLETARARGREAYAEVVGFGAAQSRAPYEAMAIGARHADGSVPGSLELGEAGAETGLVSAIRRALDDAGIGPESIDAIVPRGLGVAGPDAREALALREVFADRLAGIPIVTVTPMVGDLSAGTGGVLAAVGALCLKEQTLPARLHAGNHPSWLDVAPAPARAAKLEYVLCCSPALGGQNAAIVLRRA